MRRMCEDEPKVYTARTLAGLKMISDVPAARARLAELEELHIMVGQSLCIKARLAQLALLLPPHSI